MFIETKTITVKAGYSNKLAEKFSQQGAVEKSDGFIDLSVLVKKGKSSDEEETVVVLIRWESEEAMKNWKKSDAHIEGHRNKKDQEKPEFILKSEHALYNVKTSKTK